MYNSFLGLHVDDKRKNNTEMHLKRYRPKDTHTILFLLTDSGD
jgi:hypothetical protein